MILYSKDETCIAYWTSRFQTNFMPILMNRSVSMCNTSLSFEFYVTLSLGVTHLVASWHSCTLEAWRRVRSHTSSARDRLGGVRNMVGGLGSRAEGNIIIYIWDATKSQLFMSIEICEQKSKSQPTDNFLDNRKLCYNKLTIN